MSKASPQVPARVTRRPEPENPFDSSTELSAPVEIATTRVAQEVQASMVVAKQFPRDESKAYTKIVSACKRRSLAEKACYAYPKGGQTITGPSIRLAEVMARAWGNLEFGIVELEQRNGESQMLAFAWDMETNTRASKIFTVTHVRKTKYETKKLDDPRDIYELTANQGARRLRSCILALLPADMVEDAVEECDRTMASDGGEPIADRIRKMLVKFMEIDPGITQEVIEKRLGHKISATNETELAMLRKVCRSLIDNMASPSDFFEMKGASASAKASSLNVSLNLEKPETAKPAEPAAAPQSDADAKRAAAMDDAYATDVSTALANLFDFAKGKNAKLTRNEFDAAMAKCGKIWNCAIGDFTVDDFVSLHNAISADLFGWDTGEIYAAAGE